MTFIIKNIANFYLEYYSEIQVLAFKEEVATVKRRPDPYP